MANLSLFKLFAINKSLIFEDEAVREKALRSPGDFIGCTRDEQLVQWLSQNRLVAPFAWKGCDQDTEDHRSYGEGNADHRPDMAQHVPQNGIILAADAVPKPPNHD